MVKAIIEFLKIYWVCDFKPSPPPGGTPSGGHVLITSPNKFNLNLTN